MMNTKIENCNNELLDQQKEELTKEIIVGTNKDAFKIFDIEAGCRKTRTAEEALAEMVKSTKKYAIFVRLNNKDCRESVININKLAGKKVAFAYNNEDVNQNQRSKILKDLPEIRIIVITHQKYKTLSLDKNQRNIFIKNRTVLVIDEFISEVEKIVLSPSDINTYKELFKYDHILYETYLKTVSSLEDYIKTYPSGRNFARFVDYSPSKNFSTLIRLIKVNITSESLREKIQEIILNNDLNNINLSLLSELKTVKQLCSKIETIKEFFVHTCITDNSTFYTTDSRVKNWLLDNNILLDASGELQIAYNLNNSLYQLNHCEKVLNHSDWKLINIKVNTTTSGKEKMLKFYDVVNDQIKKYDEDILVIGNKNELSSINLLNENKGYFGNITGSNVWSNKSHVAIIQTHNLNDIDYILTFLHYSKDYVNEKITLTSSNSGRKIMKRYSFVDSRFEQIRNHWIASETYQAIKRVNRNMNKSTDALIFMNNDEVIKLLASQLLGCKVETLLIDENEFKYIESKQDDYIKELQDNSYANKFIDLMADVQNNDYKDLNISDNKISKKDVREYLGLKTSSNFSSKVLSKTNVISYCNTRSIDLSGKYITFKTV